MVEAVILELAPNEDDEFIVVLEPEKLIVGAEAIGSLNSAVIETIVGGMLVDPGPACYEQWGAAAATW